MNWFRCIAVALAVAVALPLRAAPVQASEPALTIVDHSIGTARSLTVGQLEQYKVVRLETSTPWTDVRTQFEGVLLRDLLADRLAPDIDIVVTAYNDYSAKIPALDLDEYDILLAWRADGRRLTLSDKGPFWIIYPLDALGRDASRHLHKMVWQVRSIELVR
jgi:hypothetical protein